VENHALSSSDLQESVRAASRIQKPSLKARTFQQQASAAVHIKENAARLRK
jgi:hypothetical protein